MALPAWGSVRSVLQRPHPSHRFSIGLSSRSEGTIKRSAKMPGVEFRGRTGSVTVPASYRPDNTIRTRRTVAPTLQSPFERGRRPRRVWGSDKRARFSRTCHGLRGDCVTGPPASTRYILTMNIVYRYRHHGRADDANSCGIRRRGSSRRGRNPAQALRRDVERLPAARGRRLRHHHGPARPRACVSRR